MELPRILIIGKNGQVGYELRRTLAPLASVVAVDYPDIDLTSGDSIRQWVRESKARVVINAAAYTAVDKAESETERAMQINGEAPGIIAEEAAKLGSLMVHYSTDYVFPGDQSTPYVETDEPGPLGAYGRTKLAGDLAVQAVGGAHLIFRLCWVYGSRGQNFMLTMMRLARERETVRVVSDQIGCPTWSRMIAEATAQAVRTTLSKVASPKDFSGVYHLSATGRTSWHGFAQAIIDRIPAVEKKCHAVIPITTAEYPTPAKRPSFSLMDCSKLERTFGIRLPEWQESLAQVLEP
jgi:dTDP-4-dehydrorhamnose reductase